ncbi:MAG: hypothetical protein M3415_02725 [Actinomycetota bacterium]|jgi:hypothetical protein|nr:hypothetical protein [Actinomycetota bacterium]
MPRERSNPPDSTSGERIHRRLSTQPELELTDEELRALADEGIDPDDVRRVAREGSDTQEASEHDRDTARDQLEGLAIEQEEEY